MGATLRFTIVLAMAAGACATADIDRARNAPSVGQLAPDFDLPADPKDEAAPRKLSDLRGKSVLLVFYPKAFSRGCTRQLNEYRDDQSLFEETETEIIAISADSQETSDRFKEANNFPFIVIGDSDYSTIQDYGVPMNPYLGTLYAQRAVFLIDPCGVVRYAELDYSVSRGKDKLYDQIRALSKKRPGANDPLGTS